MIRALSEYYNADYICRGLSSPLHTQHSLESMTYDQVYQLYREVYPETFRVDSEFIIPGDHENIRKRARTQKN